MNNIPDCPRALWSHSIGNTKITKESHEDSPTLIIHGIVYFGPYEKNVHILKNQKQEIRSILIEVKKRGKYRIRKMHHLTKGNPIVNDFLGIRFVHFKVKKPVSYDRSKTTPEGQ